MSVATEATVLRRAGDPRTGEAPPFEALALEHVMLAEPAAGEVMVEVATAAICQKKHPT